VNAAGRRFGHLADGGNGADGFQIVRGRILGLGGLQRKEQQAIAGEGAVDAFDGDWTRNRQRLQRERKDDGFAKRQRRKLAWIHSGRVGRHGQRIV
jgi:hypothetical protein